MAYVPCGDLILNCSSYKSLAQGVTKKMSSILSLSLKALNAGSQPMSTAVHRSPNKLRRSTVAPYLIYSMLWPFLNRPGSSPDPEDFGATYHTMSHERLQGLIQDRTGNKQSGPQISSAIADLKVCGLCTFFILAVLPQMWQLGNFRSGNLKKFH